VLTGRGKTALEALLPEYLRPRRWFASKTRTIRGVEIIEALPLRLGRRTPGYITLIDVSYAAGERETYVLPLGFASGEQAEAVVRDSPQAAIARIDLSDGASGLLFDATQDQDFCRALLRTIEQKREIGGKGGRLTASTTAAFRHKRGDRSVAIDPVLLNGDQSNSSIVYGDRFILKVFRRPDEGTNPDLEIGRYLTEKAGFPHTPPVAGYLEYRRGRGQPRTLAILHGYVVNEGDAWRYTLDELGRYYERALTAEPAARPQDGPIALLLFEDEGGVTAGDDLVGAYVESARLLGRRTAELHLAIAASEDDPEFAAEPFTPFYQRSLLQSMRGQSRRTFQLLRDQIDSIPLAERPLAMEVLGLESAIGERLTTVLSAPISATRLRCHGDYHLGQVLFTGDDFVIIDFEGEPARPLSERRVKRSPMRDVAGMLRSFHYAAYAALYQRGDIRPEDLPVLEPWAQRWQRRVSAAFFGAYREVAAKGGFLPEEEASRAALMEVYLIDKALYELSYELNNRPDWLRIPLLGICQLVKAGRDV
jgi:maltose alpha-D-glucosyltransferase/alpha-amylase